jgi:hypothetical protein
MLAHLSSPLWGVKFSLEAYPRMPVAGWIMLGLGALLLLQTFLIRGMKFSGVFTSLALLAYWPTAYALHWYLFNYLGDPEAGRFPSPLEIHLKDRAADCDRVLLITYGVLAGLFFLCLLESVINYHRKPRDQRKERRGVVEDNPYAAIPAPAPVPAPAAPRPATPQLAAPPRKPGPKPSAKPSPRPQAEDNPFNFT